MSKRIAILQSNYIPWKGYFDIIGMVDEFIIYDEVQFTKNDWRNRNKIKTGQGLQWITIPVFQKSLHQKISETKISLPTWSKKNWNSLQTNYGKSAFFKRYGPEMESFYHEQKSANLSEVNLAFINRICGYLGITTKISNSADYILEGSPTERLVNLCHQSKADIYLSGPAAKNYLDPTLFEKANIKLEWMNYEGYQEYPQLFPPFAHGVSIIDLIFNTGPDAHKFMKFTKL